MACINNQWKVVEPGSVSIPSPAASQAPKSEDIEPDFDRIETYQLPVERLEKDNKPPDRINSCEQRLMAAMREKASSSSTFLACM